ncbi:transporter [Wenyingzhuangia sp. chi5]|uniref:Transporter n=1 Tax=Wenyingzhuangia gilva TaxID=3057677 RepID=A0ABT8VUX1_9FLAO|nr:transporter [Wenyingzhuangia sp. chi5]MDO3695768.1 transporter [Wenyingzhuangia sp. chi5]
MQNLNKIFFTILTIVSVNSYACDVCGCGSTNNNNFTNLLGGNYVGFTYNYMYFQYKQGSFSNVPMAKDDVNTISITAQYHITNRIQINANVPYKFNHRQKASGDIHTSGMGDIMVYGLMNVLNTDSNHVLKIGAGIKLPTGTFDLQNSSLNQTSAAQLGTGSLDVLLPIKYGYHYNNLSVVLSAMYFIKGTNSDEFKFGNQTQVNTSISYGISLKNKVVISPIAGIGYDHFLASERYDIKDHRTSGTMYNANIGVQLETKRIVVGLNTQLPIKQNLIDNEVVFKNGVGLYTYWKF